MRYHAPTVVMRLNNSWSMVSVSYVENHAPPVVMKFEQQLEYVSSVGNHAIPVVTKVKQ